MSSPIEMSQNDLQQAAPEPSKISPSSPASADTTGQKSTRPLWSLADVPYGAIDPQKIVADTDWFYLLAGASFVEILSDLYTRNLVSYYADDEEAVAWLETEWQPEEMQHGRALRQYVETVWPDFDWEWAFAGFRQDYTPYCRTELLGPSRALEMAERCVVETGTSSFYAMIQAASPEPVLAQLASRIRNDEVHHYKYSTGFFVIIRSRKTTPAGRLADNCGDG